MDGLQIEKVSVRFGGHLAVDELSLAAPRGSITALIGPNGAGKTTTFNVCSGLLEPTGGSVSLLGKDITRLGPAGRAQQGLGRTFQRVQISHALTVRENVLIGSESRAAGGNVLKQLIGRGAAQRELEGRVDDALERCGIADLAARPAGTLSTGQHRLLELARVLASGASLLLLDEPSSGLDDNETEHFGALLEEVVADSGVGIVLVEHDMDLVLGICARVFVIDFGKLIFEGTASECRHSDVVRAAYLGTEEVA